MTKYLLYNSRLVRPEMEKPRPIDYPLEHEEIWEYYLMSLPGIECSEELLAKFGEGDEMVEGKDFVLEKWIGKEWIAVPVQSDEEDVEGTWKNVMRIFREAHSESEAINQLKQQYKLTKRCQ